MKTEAEKVENLRLLNISGNQVSCFLLERVHVFPSLPFTPDVSIEAFLVAFVSAQI